MHLTDIFTTRKQSLRRLCFYTCLSVILFTGGMGHAWQEGWGCVWQGGMHGGGHAWQGRAWSGHAWQAGGMHGRGCMVGGMHIRGACMAWWGVCGMHAPNTTRYCRSMRGRYASYWNAFLSLIFLYLWRAYV